MPSALKTCPYTDFSAIRHPTLHVLLIEQQCSTDIILQAISLPQAPLHFSWVCIPGLIERLIFKEPRSKSCRHHNIFNLLPAEYHKFAYTHNTLAQILLECFRESIDDLRQISDLAVFSNLWTDKFPLNEFHTPVEAELLTLKNSYSTDASLVLSIIDQVQGEIRSSQINKSYRKQFPQGLPNCGRGKSSNSVCFTIETAS